MQIIGTGNLPQLAARRRDCHKGQLGHVLVVAGGAGMGGAGLLTAQSSLRLGAGLVTLASMPEHVVASLCRQPEIMARAVTQAAHLRPLLDSCSVIVAGPGLGMTPWATELLAELVQQQQPQVWDADALNLLAARRAVRPAGARLVLTPHPGEAARLLGWSTAAVQQQRERAVQELAARYSAVVVLKGAQTLVADEAGQVCLCQRGHPVMAGAGFGDVLAGVIGALLAQGMADFDAACLAVYLHACAGEQLAVLGRGVVASDLLEPMRRLLQQHSPV